VANDERLDNDPSGTLRNQQTTATLIFSARNFGSSSARFAVTQPSQRIRTHATDHAQAFRTIAFSAFSSAANR
jgi:hypothetical protein